jgi:hypothetical protein
MVGLENLQSAQSVWTSISERVHRNRRMTLPRTRARCPLPQALCLRIACSDLLSVHKTRDLNDEQKSIAARKICSAIEQYSDDFWQAKARNSEELSEKLQANQDQYEKCASKAKLQ